MSVLEITIPAEKLTHKKRERKKLFIRVINHVFHTVTHAGNIKWEGTLFSWDLDKMWIGVTGKHTQLINVTSALKANGYNVKESQYSLKELGL